MSEDKFLARWSRRKQKARENVVPPEPEKPAGAPTEPPPPVAEGHEPEVELSTLPAVDSITAATDVTAFLRKGIPQELSRAALRRAWASDPAIRDLVGLAENAWDFNDPTAMPGFGPLDCSEGELAALVDRIVGGVRKSAEALPEISVEAEDSSRELGQAETSSTEVVEDSATSQLASAPVATQQTVAETTQSEHEPMRRRTHGGALPRWSPDEKL